MLPKEIDDRVARIGFMIIMLAAIVAAGQVGYDADGWLGALLMAGIFGFIVFLAMRGLFQDSSRYQVPIIPDDDD